MRTRLLATLVGSAAIASALVASSGAMVPAVAGTRPAGVTATGVWGKAERLPGTRPRSAVLSVSCAVVKDCTAGGTGFVDSETKGTWGKAGPVPGTSGLGVQWSVSCAAPGDCGAAGNDSGVVYVASQRNGRWAQAVKVTGLGGDVTVSALSCGAIGSCVAGGSYRDGGHHTQAFIVAESAGAWKKAQPVPGLVTLNKGGFAALTAVSCVSAGNCTGGGLYTSGTGAQQAFVLAQAGGKWHAAASLPGLPALNKGGYAEVSTISCTSSSACGAGGIYTDGGFNNTAFAVSRKNGAWGTSLKLGGINGLSAGPSVGIDQISCSSAGNCGAGGFYTDADDSQQAFVASEINGTWSAGEPVPGTTSLNTGLSALVASVSCRSKGNCTAGGLYTLASGPSVVFVVGEVHGTWGTAKTVSGVGDYDSLYSVSCAAPASCVAGLGARPGSPGDSYVVTERPAS